MVEATRQMGTEHGYIGGDVREKFGVARYFPRVYEEHLKDATQQARRSGFGAQDFFSQEREIPHLSDPEAQALKPLDSFSEPMSWYLLHAWDSEAKYNFVESLKTLNQAGVDMIADTKQAPKDWVWGGNFSPKFQAYSFHPDMALVLENLHPTKALRRDPLLHAAAQTWATLKDAMLSTSGFHFATEMNQIVTALPIERHPLEVGKIISRTLYHSLIPGAKRNWELKNLDLMVDAANDGLMFMGGHMAAEAMPTISGQSGLLTGPAGLAVRAIGSGGPMAIAQYQRETSQGTDPQQAAFDAALWGGGAAAFGVTGGLWLRNMLWNDGVPTMKLLTYGLLREKHGGKIAAEFANEVFGGQNLGAIARSKTVQGTLRAMTFAADWQEGWVRQLVNFFRPGPLGDLNRAYWARATVMSAFLLEGLNVAFNGHSSADNADGNQFRLKMTGLYDHLGVPHKDDRGRNYDPYMDILGPYRSFLEMGQWTAQQAGAPVPRAPTDLARYVDSRLGPVPAILISGIQNKDWKGDPITAPNDSAAIAAMKFGAHVFGNYAPVGPSDIAQSNGNPAALAAFSALTGRKITHVTPAAAMFKQTDDIFRKVGISQDQYRRDQEMYGNLIAQAAANRNKIVDDPKLTMQERLRLIGKERIPSRPEWTSAELLDKVPNDMDRTGVNKQVAQHGPGVQGSTAPADPEPGIDVALLSDRYWSAAKPVANDAVRANLLRQKELFKMAVETGQDQLALRDAIFWRARHPDGTPLPAANVPSEEVDNWVNQWHDSAANVDPTDALAVSEAKWTALNQISSTSGLPEETVWSRIKTRMTTLNSGTVSPNDVAIENAFDALTTANPKRFPKYVGPDGKPLPGDPAQMDRQLAEATSREKKADPQIHALQQAQEAGVSARKQYLMLQSPTKTDYERVFGIGRNMTDKEWEQYTSNPSGHYSDKPTEKEARHRDAIITMYRAASPLQRRSVNVQITHEGQVKSVPLTLAYREYEARFDKKWRGKAVDLPAVEDATPATAP